MFGCYYFKKLFDQLDYSHKIILLSNIFDLEDISSFSVLIRKNRIIFRFFCHSFFIQYIFIFDCKKSSFIECYSQKRIECYYIYPKSYENYFDCPYCSLVSLFLCSDKEKITDIFNSFLV